MYSVILKPVSAAGLMAWKKCYIFPVLAGRYQQIDHAKKTAPANAGPFVDKKAPVSETAQGSPQHRPQAVKIDKPLLV